jgi:cytochrome P450
VLPACSIALAAAVDLLRWDARAQANIFLLAGYDTTASALASTCYLLSANPDKQAKLLQARPAQGDMPGRASLGPC